MAKTPAQRLIAAKFPMRRSRPDFPINTAGSRVPTLEIVSSPLQRVSAHYGGPVLDE